LTRAEAVVFIAGIKKKLGDVFTLKARPATASSKLDLPQIGLKSENVVGKRDAILEAEAIKVNQVVSRYEMYAAYNSGDKAIFIRSSDDYIIMSYRDTTDEVDGYIVIGGSFLMKGSNVRTDRVEAMVEVMKTLGWKVDFKLTDAITRTLGAGEEGETVEYSGFNVEILKIKYGTIAMYINER